MQRSSWRITNGNSWTILWWLLQALFFVSSVKSRKVTKKAKPVTLNRNEIKIVTIFERQIVIRKRIGSSISSRLRIPHHHQRILNNKTKKLQKIREKSWNVLKNFWRLQNAKNHIQSYSSWRHCQKRVKIRSSIESLLLSMRSNGSNFR